MKTLVKIIVWIVAVIAVILVSSPLWLGPVAKIAAEKIGPQWTGTPLEVESIALNPFSGHFAMKGFRLGNPAGSDIKDAASLGGLTVDVDIFSVLSKKIHFRRILIDQPYVSYLSINGKNNFDTIAANAKAKAGEGKKPAAEEKKPAEKPADASAEKPAEGEGVKVQIDELAITGTRVQISSVMPVLPLPSLTLRDIGKDKPEGASWKEAVDSVWGELQKGMTGLGNALGSLGSSLGGSATKGAKQATEALTSGLKDLGKSVKVDSVTEGAANAGKAVGDTAAEAGKAVGEGAKKLFKGLGL